MLYIFLIGVFISILRLIGYNTELFQVISHAFLGGLVGYWLGTYEWFIGLCAALMIGVEIEAYVRKLLPSFSIINIITKLL